MLCFMNLEIPSWNWHISRCWFTAIFSVKYQVLFLIHMIFFCFCKLFIEQKEKTLCSHVCTMFVRIECIHWQLFSLWKYCQQDHCVRIYIYMSMYKSSLWERQYLPISKARQNKRKREEDIFRSENSCSFKLMLITPALFVLLLCSQGTKSYICRLHSTLSFHISMSE